ncbi:phosphate ABC transporter permease [Photobacterium jeanii]|uniref:Phosphate ABC transporter permease n=1 Tax=Photobacterium jeanii TaxID=858640 RepID=A0A178KA94_9GAMM|nr:ABC transporter permease subunit [Photobacterium jeanii]OAN14258.1 phosphate ABC transporter permease [Photobacterium jeanii]PST89779.1 phosphate ABC transporter permease [Photobacterium jeanii]
MADASTLFIGESRSRRLKDKLARMGVIAGGVFVLLTLVLIFFYLLYVIFPSFKPVTVTPLTQLTVAATERTVAVGLEEQNSLAYRFTAGGELSFVALDDTPIADSLPTIQVMANPSVFAASLPRDQMYAYGGDDGSVVVVHPNVKTQFVGRTKTLAAAVDYPVGTEPLQLDPQGQPLTQLAFTALSGKGIMVGITQDQRVVGMTMTAQVNAFGERTEQWRSQAMTFTQLPADIERLALTPDGRTLYVQTGQNVVVMAIEGNQVTVRDRVTVAPQGVAITNITLLSGANSLLVATSDEQVSQWFEVMAEGKWSLTHVRDYSLSASPLNQLVPESFRKSFFTWQQDGTLAAYYAASNKPVFEMADFVNDFDPQTTVLAISPRADRLVAVDGENWQVFSVDNPHPEISFASLWQQVWYESYPEPDYVWQSTSASDEFEPKLSLVPIVFGTLKAAMYAMIFAIPLAIAGAIYTAYFMSSKMRSMVKPTVEIMEALPTVILGFLAGIWLAPIVENNLVGIGLSLVMFPLMIFLVGAVWSALPGRWLHGIPNGLHIMLLMPLIVLMVYGCFTISPWLEQWWFGGDVRVFLTNEWGIGYDQRNALVVGIAMGFAVIPTIFSIAEDAIFSVPSHLASGSLALGATHWQTLTRVVLLTASPGIFSAIMMGLGRAVGETMIVLMATGNTPIMDWNVLEGLRTLSATIAIEMPESEVGSSHYRVLFIAAFVLFIFTFVFNTIAELVRQRLREKYSSL